ncbi:MAG: TonB C-terminal domain-containing protein [Desulfuromonadales bacterium]|nr:TonB C-terminal domain-containing protein [Desulfuromonadales bacterium]
MVILSAVFHATAYLVLMSPHRNVMKASTVNYLELKDLVFSENKPAAPSPPLENTTKFSDMTDPPRETPPVRPEPATEAGKLQNELRQSLADAAANQAALEQNSLGFGLTSGQFSSIADGETLRGDIREYYFNMLRVINEKWWLSKPGRFRGVREVIVNVVIERNGVIIRKELLKSSGNPDFDRSILKSLETASPLPALPKNFPLEYFIAPLRFVVPLNLLGS